MKTLDYLDKAKEKLGIESDYALAKALHVSQPTITNYRSGRSRMDDDVAVKIAKVLEIDPLETLAAAYLERAKSDESRAAWKAILEKISKGFEVLLSNESPELEPVPA